MLIKHIITSPIPNVIIEFYSEDEDASKYFFRVKDNDELTQKLLKATKHHKVPPNSFVICANALTAIILKGEFKEIIKGKSAAAYFEEFQRRYEKTAEFEIFNKSSLGDSEFKAILLNHNLDIEIAGISRTKTNAKVEALKLLFEKEPVTDADIF